MPKQQFHASMSEKGNALVSMYEDMVLNGYSTRHGEQISDTYNSFEIYKFRSALKSIFAQFQVESVLDYGSGGCDWNKNNAFEGRSAKSYFGLEKVYRYEPSRQIDERREVDAVVCFDVLEHIFISDLPFIIRDILKRASKLAVINVACYEANALLPNGENAHVTIREPSWWKGIIDGISVEFPETSIFLICSTSYGEASGFPIFCDLERHEAETFKVDN